MDRATALEIFQAVAFLLYEILLKISYIFLRKDKRIRQIDKNRRRIEIRQPFETQSGETLVGWSPFFCGVVRKRSDALVLYSEIVL